MSMEIDQLNNRLVEAETKLKTEVTRIRKKLQVTITELEMTLDVSNKNNIELQKSIKKQSLQLSVTIETTETKQHLIKLNKLTDRNFNRCTTRPNDNCKSPWTSTEHLNAVCSPWSPNSRICVATWKLYISVITITGYHC